MKTLYTTFLGCVIGALICLQTSIAFGDAIIDNGDAATSSTGTWGISGADNPFDPSDSSANSLWSRDGSQYTWTFTPTVSGYYEVFMWWTSYSSRSSSIPVDIEHWGGIDRVVINQQNNGGRWNSLNLYPFEAGVSYNVTVTSQPGPSSTCADAVQFVYQDGLNVAPVAVIDSISPNPALTTELVTFTGHGEDLDGSVIKFLWHSSINGELSQNQTFTTPTALTEGIHTISFTVEDDRGASTTITQTLIVQDTFSEFIIDNGSPQTSFTGSWGISGADNPFDPNNPAATSQWSRDGATYTWTFRPSVSGTYQVSMWWTNWSSRSNNIPVDIEHLEGSDRVTIDQQINGGQWNVLGSYPFIADTEYNITIISQPGPTSTCADAVRFVYTGSVNQPPVATIDSIAPRAATPGESISFLGSGVDGDGSVAEYEWYSDINGILSDQASFSTTALSPGTHTIFFRVRDNAAVWSQEAVTLVVVRDCGSPVKIMPLGDSITYGVGEIAQADNISGYRQPLHQAIKSSGYYVDFVGERSTGILVIPSFDIQHQGIPGTTDTQVAADVYTWLTAHPAEIVLLHIGTNSFSTDPSDVEDILNEIDRFEADSGMDITIVLARIINRQSNHSDTTVFNENIEALGRSRIATGDKIIIVDQESALNYSTDMWDNLHPNASGYGKMANVWMDTLTLLLPQCSGFQPFIYTMPVLTATAGMPYLYQVGALGNPAPVYSLESAPAGMSIDAATGEIDWTPLISQSGDYAVIVQARNSQGAVTQSFNVTVSGNDTIIDNDDPRTSFTGTWKISSATNPWDPAQSGATSLWSRDGSTYTWTFTPAVSGDYEFSMWWTQYASRSTSIPVRIASAAGTEIVTINQRLNGGIWNTIGVYPFNAGVSYNITITSQADPTSTCADAVRFLMAAPKAPSITSQPTDQSVIAGTVATFSIAADGAAPLSYQWQKNNSDIAGATAGTYTTPATTSTDNGAQFRCSVTNAVGSVTSNTATLTVTTASAPSITTHPENQSVTAGSSAVFSVTADGSAPLSYQWQKNSSDIAGATGSSYTTPATTSTDNGAGFRCRVTNAVGSVTSNTATLTVTAIAPSISSQPADQNVVLGATATFSITASGTAPLNYQWQKNGSNIAGAAGSSYTTPATTSSDNGAQFSCRVSNLAGSTTSETATLTIVASSAPVAFNDKADTKTNTPVAINVAGNDTDSDGTINPASINITSAPPNGTASARADGTVLYTPNNGYSGKDTFNYTIQDNQGVSSNSATVTVTVGLIIDNGDPGTSFTGSWSASGASDPFDPADPQATSLWSRNGDTYTWSFTPQLSGNYEISMWWTYYASRSSNIPVEIENWGGTETIYINQLANGGQWNIIGLYPFTSGQTYRVTITAVPGGTQNYSTCADAVRFVHIPTDVQPLAQIGTIGPNPVLPGNAITFSGSGVDMEGSVAGYSWYSTLDGPLSDQATFSTAELSEGVHSIFFKVRDTQGNWSEEVQTTVDVNNYLMEGTEHIYFAAGYATVNALPLMENALRSMGATQNSGIWTYHNQDRNKTYYIHPVTTKEQFVDALETQDAHVMYFGHSNYGIGQLFASDSEIKNRVIEDILYMDDDRILNSSSPVVHVNVGGMRTGQAYPNWWPVFKDGSSAIMPYEKGDPNNPPAYNYFPTYQIPGDPTHYRIETAHHGAIERFPDWGGPAWYDPNGNPPDPTNPEHDQYFITNSDPWSPSIERIGNWVAAQTQIGYYRENYEYSAAGSGADQIRWLFSIPTAADYNVYAWYPASSGNATNSPFKINHAQGSTTVPVNQRLNGGQWNRIGVFRFGVGDYSVELSDLASGGNVVADGIRVEHVDNPPEVLKADFNATNRSGPAPLDVYFDSENVGDVDTFSWDFGDGNQNSTRTSLTHTYSEPGTYTVTHTIWGPLGSSSTTEVGYITVGVPEPPLQAEFDSRTSQQGTVPFTATFRDRSSGDILSWQWDFNNDGIIDSTEKSPSFTFTEPGSYTVSLAVTDRNANTNTEVKQDFVRMVIYDKNIDNVDYPKRHYGSKTLLYRKQSEVYKDRFKYARLFYGGCDSAHYYVDTFQRGTYFFATNTTSDGEYAMVDYLKAYMNGASDYQLWLTIQAVEPLYDYYNFNKPPSQQW